MAIQKVAGRSRAGAAAPAGNTRRSAVTWPHGPCGPADAETASPHLVTLGGFALMVDNQLVQLPSSSERLLAFVALCCRAAVPRGLIAGTLWPDAPECRAHASLRSALSRLHDTGRRALEVGQGEV
ncbi:hypothetical protein AB0958_43705 [Streptomyces sp. NPDC006655]|uniref:AfsR/SARP family transcriptional regulator n=1 Tax=Streptomyces sp. NPDC006655 TaxID=3156898 RepID=UPI003454F6E0